MSRFIVIPCMGYAPGYHGDAAVVEADSAREAAIEGAKDIEAENSDVDPGYMEKVSVYPVDGYEVFTREADYVRAAVQCCGGNPYSEDGHAGGCQEARAGGS